MHQYKNPFDIKRIELLDQLARMRINFFHTAPTATRLQDQGKHHNLISTALYVSVAKVKNIVKIDPYNIIPNFFFF